MAATRWLTIGGVTRSAMEWSRQPRAAAYATIMKRLRVLHWPEAEAVFERTGARPNTGVVLAPPPKKTSAPPAPHVANPLRPRWGFGRTYPIEYLAMLRRVA